MKITFFLFIFSVIMCFRCQKSDNFDDQSNQNNKKTILSLNQNDSNYKKNTNIDYNRKYSIKTFKGLIEFSFNTKKNPNTTNRIISLINEQFYQGSKIFKVIPGYLVQFGDPSETGFGGSGKKVLDEPNNISIEQGTLCLVRPNGINSGDSILMIALAKINNSQKKYLPIGKITKGFKVLKDIKINEAILFIK